MSSISNLFIAPGVKTREFDFTAIAAQVSTTIVGMVGGATKGPVGVPTLCKNVSEFVRKFGPPIDNDQGPISAIAYLQRGDQLWYCRAASSSYEKATVKFAGVDDVPEAVADILTLTAKTEGAWANDFNATITNVTGLNFTLKIYNNDDLYLTAVTSLDSTNENYIGDMDLGDFESTVVLGDAVAINEVTSPADFTGGNDGLPLSKSDVIGVGSTGLQAFRDPNNIDVTVLVAPGRYEDDVVDELITICEERADCMTILDPPQGLSVEDVIKYHNGTLVGDDMPDTRITSSYAALYYPWVQIYDPINYKHVFVPPSGLALGAYSYNDRVAENWFAPAGLNRGELDLVYCTENEVENFDPLYMEDEFVVVSRINPIIRYKNQGYFIWGQFTCDRSTSALNRVNVRRMVTTCRKVIASSAMYLTFEMNDSFTWNQWVGMVRPELERIKVGRGIYDYKVVMDETTVTEEHISNNEMPGQVAIKPTRTAEYILIDFILKPYGAIL